MSKAKLPYRELSARVLRRADGRWEVLVSESEGTDASRRWRHKKLFRTEQEADIFARSLLPYSSLAWSAQTGGQARTPEYNIMVPSPEKNRKPRHYHTED